MMEQKTNLAISNTMRNIFGLFGISTWALGSTTNAMVSNLVGQNKKEMIPILLKKLLLINISSALFFSAMLNLFPVQIFHFFSEDANFVTKAIPTIRIISLAIIIMSVSVVCINTVIGLGKANYAFYIEAATIFIYCLYTYFSLEVFKVNLATAWMNEWLYWVVMFLGAWLYLRKALLPHSTKP
jgi:multidrug resistance protein, MATE family